MGRGAETTTSHSCQDHNHKHEVIAVEGEGEDKVVEIEEYDDLPQNLLNEDAWETLVRRRHLLQVWHFSPYRLTLDQSQGAKVMVEKKGQLEGCSTIVKEYFPEELFTKETTAKSDEIRNISLSVHETEDLHNHKDTGERIAQLEQEEMLMETSLHGNGIKEEEDGEGLPTENGLNETLGHQGHGDDGLHQDHPHIKQEPQDHAHARKSGQMHNTPGSRSNEGDEGNQAGKDQEDEDFNQMEEDFYDEEELFPNEYDDDEGYNDPYDDDRGNGEQSYYT
jgi:hypothetical protein